MSFFSNTLNGVDFKSDWLLILIFLGVGFGYGLALGKNRLNLITLASYFSLLITRAIPWKQLDFLGIKSAPNINVQIFLFLAIILAIFFLASHSGLGSLIRISGRGQASWWQILILGVLQIGFLISAIISFLPNKIITDLNPLIKEFFSDELARFLWLILPLIAIFVLKKRKKYSYREDE
jgi:hypothetical protein